MIGKPVDDLKYGDFDALVGHVRETRTIDFKRDLVGPRDDDKRELLADVSSFANTAGGDLIFGIDSKKGIASAVVGVTLADPDAEILRLESILRTGLEPRLARVEMRWIPGHDNRGVLIVRTTRSWTAPHRVIFRDHAKFYARNSAGKYALDTSELRSAFVNAEGTIQNIRRFRQERVAVVEADEGPVALRPTAKMIFHIIPLSAFAAPQDIVIDDNRDLIMPPGPSGGFNRRHTLEGLASYVGREDVIESMFSYTLLFRSGVIEAVSAIGYGDQHGPIIAPSRIEWDLITVFDGYLEALIRHAIEPPYYVFLSLAAVRDHRLYSGRPTFAPSVRRDVLLLPEITINDAKLNAEQALRPLFDLFWNAFGFPRSFSFDKDGKYIGERY